MFAVLFGGATALLPIYTKDILLVGPTGLGWLRAAPSGGAVGMAMVLAHRPPLKRAGPALILAVIGFGAATIVFGLSRSFALSMVMLLILGALDNISVVIRNTLTLTRTPNAMRGRVSAISGLFVSISNQLGEFESGLTAQVFGPVTSVVAGGVATILAGARFQRNAVPWLVGLYITAAYWFTASTSFANPAVAIARSLTNTFAGIRPADLPGFILAELCGAFAGMLLMNWLLGPSHARGPVPTAETSR